jgi:hypothetical protein
MSVSDSDNTDESASGAEGNRLVATWRTVQKLDADEWRRLRDDAPLRFVRWLGALGLLIGAWDVMGTPKTAIAWLPVLGILAVLLLPDASSIGFGGFSYQVRQAAEQATKASETASATVSRLEMDIKVGTQAGEAAGKSAQARSAPASPADEALREFLTGSVDTDDSPA